MNGSLVVNTMVNLKGKYSSAFKMRLVERLDHGSNNLSLQETIFSDNPTGLRAIYTISQLAEYATKYSESDC